MARTLYKIIPRHSGVAAVRVASARDEFSARAHRAEAAEAQVERLLELISRMRAQWIHSIHAEACLAALKGEQK